MVALLLLLLIVRIEPAWFGPPVYLVTASLLVGLIILIRDTDNPSECDRLPQADTDLRQLCEVERLLFTNPDAKD